MKASSCAQPTRLLFRSAEAADMHCLCATPQALSICLATRRHLLHISPPMVKPLSHDPHGRPFKDATHQHVHSPWPFSPNTHLNTTLLSSFQPRYSSARLLTWLPCRWTPLSRAAALRGPSPGTNARGAARQGTFAARFRSTPTWPGERARGRHGSSTISLCA